MAADGMRMANQTEVGQLPTLVGVRTRPLEQLLHLDNRLLNA